MLISRPQIDAVLKEIVNRAGAVVSDPSKLIIVAVGGTALCINHIRMASYDIDLFCSSELKPLVESLEEELKSRYGERFRLDVTDQDTVWGQLRIKDIGQSPEFQRHQVGDDLFVMRSLDPATLFIMKSCSGRDRDIDDVLLISQHVTMDEVLERLGEIATFNGGMEFLELTLSELQAHYLEPVSEEMIDKVNLDRKRKAELMTIFNVNANSAGNRYA